LTIIEVVLNNNYNPDSDKNLKLNIKIFDI
jgi:hypothetical protein